MAQSDRHPCWRDLMTVETHAGGSTGIDPRRHHDSVAEARPAAPGAPPPRPSHDSAGDARRPAATHDPVCLYLETTNRCNLLCTTCPRTYEQLEPEADMPWELFTSLINQYPNIARVA